MALFRPAEVTSAYLKMGLLGFAGSGKTKTASLTAVGLVQYARQKKIDYADKPVFFLDTETGSDWVKPDFDKAGVPLMVAKTRAFVDLLAAVEEAQKHGSILLIDSITHFWKELCDSYTREKAKRVKNPTYKLQFQDWGYLKGEWGKFTDAYINSPLHIILAGRAGYEYDYFENDEGKKELEKTGVKMKAEGEMGYEPSLLVHMERCQRIAGGSVESTWREATILKDRSTLLDGKVFQNPTFQHFLPHIERLNLGGKQLGVDTTRTSAHAIAVEKKDWSSTQRQIVLEEIEAVLVEHYPSTTKEDKQAKAALILKHFGTRSWTEVCMMQVADLRSRYDALHRELTGVPSRYSGPVAAIDDEIPDFDKQEAATNAEAPATQPGQPSIEDTLLAQIGELATTNDVLHLTGEIARLDLAPESKARITAALNNRLGEIARGSKPGDAGGRQEEATENGEGGNHPVAPAPGSTKARSRRAPVNVLAAG